MLTAQRSSSCPHGRRGTTVCLYCRQEARDLSRRRRNHVLTRFGMTALGGGVVIALIVGGLIALAPDASSTDAGSTDATNDTARVVASANGTSVATTAGVPRVSSVHTPQIPQGRKELGGGVVAERSGDEVTVNFDTDSLRTRIDWKFEGVVRGTLPLVFGEPARIALDAVPRGSFARGGDLLTDHAQRGIKLSLADLGTLTVWPIVRPGRDGRLIVAYRAIVAR